jgi:hypothetical protein
MATQLNSQRKCHSGRGELRPNRPAQAAAAYRQEIHEMIPATTANVILLQID